ncbi:hypothetical protein P872_08480 [Rhodonellum psychrophilum GCM71 = DSM 17998]|uniref:Uncharacterized protein n=1 Tax=Rhodonellum psychrophilum GCM71 = DSM 17998 TaxID=1123057 RepID=U5BZJ6_9BACT|nr:hypothetical protein P872_08480 [Rhodonellum psychrophilum GCM71 = DSM 17998]
MSWVFYGIGEMITGEWRKAKGWRLLVLGVIFKHCNVAPDLGLHKNKVFIKKQNNCKIKSH